MKDVDHMDLAQNLYQRTTYAVARFLGAVAAMPAAHLTGRQQAQQQRVRVTHEVTHLNFRCQANFEPDGTIVWVMPLDTLNGTGSLWIYESSQQWLIHSQMQDNSWTTVADSQQFATSLDTTVYQAIVHEVEQKLMAYAQVWLSAPAPTQTQAQPANVPPMAQPGQSASRKLSFRAVFETPYMAVALAVLATCSGVFGLIPIFLSFTSLAMQWVKARRHPQPLNWLLIGATAIVGILFLVVCWSVVSKLIEAQEYLETPMP